jgi:hypothetical protein
MREEVASHTPLLVMVSLLAIDRSLVIIPKISGSLSFISSGILARHIAKKSFKDVSITSRMLFGISIVDIICSFVCYFLSSWMAPRGTLPYAVGNTATCNFQGFVFVFSLIYFATAYAELSVICELNEMIVNKKSKWLLCSFFSSS